MLYLMNSAMMPQDGTYIKETISPKKAREIFEKAPAVKSAIGYANAQNAIEQILGVKPELCRDVVEFKHADTAICFQLKYRILSPEEKASNIHGKAMDDYNISLVFYMEN